ncbi:MAG: FAD-binding oxidoreductase [Alphaproteobacteria bacterium]|nr:FAD-binding oxidoreductase [Alphaproteobacteria bacterium]MDE2011589.1 FAD-binding oxidoreductase [Alphaproteobacteria bacterium]MDE2071935.1 FAD-binding oxidoreductase [Alphaproteobacteria bacterium]MDE2353057.1 FAD-binding oxidoreductase [Alphaproteobacteria bacterium]
MSFDHSKLRWNGWGLAAHKDAVAADEAVWNWLAERLGMPSLLATPARPLEEIALPVPRLSEQDRAALTAIVGAERILEDDYARAYHARGKSYHDLLHLRAGDLSCAPDAVVCPRGGEEVGAILRFADAQGIAVVPYGGGSSVVGGVTAEKGPLRAVISLDLSGLDRLIDIDPVSQTATLEAGISGPALEKALAAKGMTLGHYPQSFEFSTLGGWISHRGAGQASSRYGRAEDWLVSVKLATPRGLLATEDFPASAAGPRLTDLVVGAEGQFGIVTEATVRVHPVPAVRDYRGFLFHDFAGGAAAIREAVQAELPVAMLRLSDAGETGFYRTFSGLGKRKGLKDWIEGRVLSMRGFDANMAAMIVGLEGDAGTVAYARQHVEAIAKRLGAMPLGTGAGKRWLAGRFHGPYLRDPLLERGVGVDTLETATSWSKLDGLYAAVKTALETSIADTAPRPGARGIVMCHISHSYRDGASLYFTHIFPRTLDGEITQWQAIKKAAGDAVAANGGTISHHHGVGEDHLPWIAAEKGALGVEVLRAIKDTLDPKGILNPGKLIPR